MILTFITNPSKIVLEILKKILQFSFFHNIKLLTLFIKSLYTDEPFIEDSDLKLYNLKKIFPYLILIPLIEEFS
jgi:hypothetical protein